MTTKLEKPSYKNIVLVEQTTETKQSCKETVNIIGYDNIMNSLNEQKKERIGYSKNCNTSKKEFMIDILDELSYVTGYVNGYYGLHGIGDELKLEDVIDSLDKSVIVEVFSDNEYDIESCEDELQ